MRSRLILAIASLVVVGMVLWISDSFSDYKSGRLLVDEGEGLFRLCIREVPAAPSVSDFLLRNGNYLYACELKSHGLKITTCMFNLGGSYRVAGRPHVKVSQPNTSSERYIYYFGDGRMASCRYSEQSGADWQLGNDGVSRR